MSIDADDPRRVAEVLAEIWDGRAVPFPPVAAGSWMALAQDERNNSIEVYPRGITLARARGEADPVTITVPPRMSSATHIAIGTRRTRDEIFAIAKRESWSAKYRRRGQRFGVIEMWIEDWRMVEVLTPDMQAEYLAMTDSPS